MMLLIIFGCVVCLYFAGVFLHRRHQMHKGQKLAGKETNSALSQVEGRYRRRNGCIEVNGREYLDSSGAKALDNVMNRDDPRFCGAREWHDDF